MPMIGCVALAVVIAMHAAYFDAGDLYLHLTIAGGGVAVAFSRPRSAVILLGGWLVLVGVGWGIRLAFPGLVD